MKVHVTLKRDIRTNPEAKIAALARLQEETGLLEYNESRFLRYGIFSADIQANALERLSSLDEVQSVSVDAEKHALEV